MKINFPTLKKLPTFAAIIATPQSEKSFKMKNHNLYKTGDLDAPSIIKDQNGEVVLAMCRDCKRAESDLPEVCNADPAESTPSKKSHAHKAQKRFNVWDVDNKRMFKSAVVLTDHGYTTLVNFKTHSSLNLIWLECFNIEIEDGHSIEICEGDVIRYEAVITDHVEKMVSQVSLLEGCLYPFYEHFGAKSGTLRESEIYLETVKVLGNIYQNPELLESPQIRKNKK